MFRKKVGFIGLGVMGGPMARHILNAGYEVTAYSKTLLKVENFAKLGGRAANSPAETAELCDVLISCLVDNENVREVLFTGEKAAINGAKPGTLFIDTTTISPKAAREFSDRAKEEGVIYLDAPLTGGQKGAEEAKLTIMVGGDKDAIPTAEEILNPTAQKIVYVGESGMGQTLKMANQIAGMLNIVGMSESLLFCRNAGIDLEMAIDVIGRGASGSWAMNFLGPRVIDRNFTPGFSVDLQQKDLRYALEAADELKVPLPGTALCNQLYRSLLANGEGDLAFPAVTLVLERLAGLHLPIRKDVV